MGEVNGYGTNKKKAVAAINAMKQKYRVLGVKPKAGDCMVRNKRKYLA